MSPPPRTLIAAAGIVFLMTLCGCGQRGHDMLVGPRLVIMTYNINYGMPDPEAAAAAIETGDADVVCLQETTVEWENFLRQRLARAYPHMAFHNNRAAGGLAILSRVPFSEAAILAPTAGWFPASLYRVKTPLGQVQVLNVHLRPSLSDQGKVTFGAIFGTPAIRKAEIESFYSSVSAADPLIVLGDFNEGDSGGAVQWLAGRGLRDALGQFNLFSETWRAPHPLPFTARFDHIVHSRDMRCWHAFVIKAGQSDHYPVVAVMAPNPSTKTGQPK